MTKNLVIVESPAKAKTIKKHLGSGYKVMASYGHVRDLPVKSFGIKIDNNYEPEYQIMSDKRDTIKKLKESLKDIDNVYLATDPDREGEAISFHLAHILKIDPSTNCRITFNEITKKAIDKALDNKRPIDINMYNAQQARRVLDRIVGYKASPLLWKKIRKGLSAGRVQSVALRLVCEKEAEIKAFVPQEYWLLNLKLSKFNEDRIFIAKYHGSGGRKKALNKEEDVNKVIDAVNNNPIVVKSTTISERKRYPSPPFITSTMQQEASNKLAYSTSRTMRIAQQLYEGLTIKDEGSIGLITYMRTDSVRIANDFLYLTKEFIEKTYGKEFSPEKFNYYKNKKGAQDAHEAIRPTDLSMTPQRVASSLTKEQLNLYTLIFNRYIASQMTPAIIENVTIDIESEKHLFKASGNKTLFKGFLSVYEDYKQEKDDNGEDNLDGDNVYLPNVKDNEQLENKGLLKAQKFTNPPSRYTEASLVRVLEEKGIGRPSTYAPTINVIIKRNYVEKEKRSLVPTDLGIIVNDYMVENFKELLDYDFTADMEKNLDDIESAKIDWVSIIDKFYKDFIQQIDIADKNTKKIVIESDQVCELCGKKMLVKTSRYGDFLGCSGYPECKNTKPILSDTGYKCPKCQGRVINKKTKTGKTFISCENYPKCDFSSWGTITGDMCPKCGNFLVKVFENRKTLVKCSLDTCDYIAEPVKSSKKKKDDE